MKRLTARLHQCRVPLATPLLSLFILLALLCPIGTLAAEPMTLAVRLFDSRTISGTMASLENDVLSMTVDGRPASFPIDDLIAIDFASPAGTPTAKSWLLLANGDRAPLAPIDLVDDAFVCRWLSERERPNWRVPLELVTGLLRQPLNQTGETSLLPELSRRGFDEDTLILGDGTRLAGALEAVTADSFRVETAVGGVPVDAARVEALAMNVALLQRPAAVDRAALVHLGDGTCVSLQALAISAAGTLTGRTGFDAELLAPLSEVARINFYGARVIDLTTREPPSVSVVPFVSRTSQMLVNRNVRGGWLQLGGRDYTRGFGMTSGMTATFALEPDDRQFQATVGLDDSVGEAGSVVFAVAVDGRRLFTSPVVRGGDAPLVIGPLDIADGKQLSLSVEFAEYGNVQDVANWCDPVILR